MHAGTRYCKHVFPLAAYLFVWIHPTSLCMCVCLCLRYFPKTSANYKLQIPSPFHELNLLCSPLPQPKWLLVCYCPNPNDYSYATAPTQMMTRMLLSQSKWLLVYYCPNPNDYSYATVPTQMITRMLSLSLPLHTCITHVYIRILHTCIQTLLYYARATLLCPLRNQFKTSSISSKVMITNAIHNGKHLIWSRLWYIFYIYVHISSSDYRSGWGVSRPFIVPAPPAFSQIKSNHRLAIVCGSSHCPTNGIQATTWPSWPRRLFCQQRLETRLPKGSTKVRRQKNKRKSKANSRRKWIICMVMNSRKRFLMPWCSRCCGDDKRLLQHFESNHKLWR